MHSTPKSNGKVDAPKKSSKGKGRFRFSYEPPNRHLGGPTGEKRLLDNWLQNFLDWSLPRSESPANFILWSGLYALAAVAKRNVIIPKSLMGGYEIVPNLYVLFVAKPGVARKSTSSGFGEGLLTQVPGVNLAPSSISASKLLGHMSTLEDGTISIVSSEFSSFVGTSKESMFEVLTDLYDGKLKHEHMTRMHGSEKIDKPVINLIASTTPKWIASQPSEHLIGGGFASRVVMVYEENVRERKLYYDHIDWSVIENMEQLLVNDLIYISKLRGEFKHETLALKKDMEDWYKHMMENLQVDERVEGYFQRKHVHIHKVAMLLSLSESDKLVITKGNFEDAKKVLETIEPNMHRALSAATKNPFSTELEAVLEFIKNQPKPVEKGKIMSRFYQAMNMSILDEILSSLVVMGDVKVDRVNGKARYSA